MACLALCALPLRKTRRSGLTSPIPLDRYSRVYYMRLVSNQQVKKRHVEVIEAVSSTILSLIGLSIGFVIGFLAEQFIAEDKPDLPPARAIRRRLVAGLIGAIIAHVGIQSLITQETILEVHKQIIDTSDYEKARKWLIRQDGKTRYLFDILFERVDPWLRGISSGEVRVNIPLTIEFWHRGFEVMRSGEEVLATNLLSQADWKKINSDNAAYKVQAAAKTRGVSLKRIMIYDPADPQQKKDLRELAKFHRQAGIEVKEIPVTSLQGPDFDNWLRTFGSWDFILFGSTTLLVSETHPSTKNLLGAKIFTQREKLASAKSVHNRIWTMAVEIPN